MKIFPPWKTLGEGVPGIPSPSFNLTQAGWGPGSPRCNAPRPSTRHLRAAGFGAAATRSALRRPGWRSHLTGVTAFSVADDVFTKLLPGVPRTPRIDAVRHG